MGTQSARGNSEPNSAPVRHKCDGVIRILEEDRLESRGVSKEDSGMCWLEVKVVTPGAGLGEVEARVRRSDHASHRLAGRGPKNRGKRQNTRSLQFTTAIVCIRALRLQITQRDG